MRLFYPQPYTQNIYTNNSGDRPKHDPPQPYAYIAVLCMSQRSGGISANCYFAGALSRGYIILRASDIISQHAKSSC